MGSLGCLLPQLCHLLLFPPPTPHPSPKPTQVGSESDFRFGGWVGAARGMVETQHLSQRKLCSSLSYCLPLPIWSLENSPGLRKKPPPAPPFPSLQDAPGLPPCCPGGLWPSAALALDGGGLLFAHSSPLHQFSTIISPPWKSFLRSTLSLLYYKRTIVQHAISHSLPFSSGTQNFSGVGEVGNFQSSLLTERIGKIELYASGT